MTKYRVEYNGRFIGYENAPDAKTALKRLAAANPSHLADKFKVFRPSIRVAAAMSAELNRYRHG